MKKKFKLLFWKNLFRVSSSIGFFFMDISQKAMHNANEIIFSDIPEELPKSSYSDFIKNIEEKK